MKQTEILTHATHVNGWEPAVYMSCMSQNFRLFHVSNLSVRNFRIFLLMYPGSVMTCRRRPPGRGCFVCMVIPRPWPRRHLARPETPGGWGGGGGQKTRSTRRHAGSEGESSVRARRRQMSMNVFTVHLRREWKVTRLFGMKDGAPAALAKNRLRERKACGFPAGGKWK